MTLVLTVSTRWTRAPVCRFQKDTSTRTYGTTQREVADHASEASGLIVHDKDRAKHKITWTMSHATKETKRETHWAIREAHDTAVMQKYHAHHPNLTATHILTAPQDRLHYQSRHACAESACKARRPSPSSRSLERPAQDIRATRPRLLFRRRRFPRIRRGMHSTVCILHNRKSDMLPARGTGSPSPRFIMRWCRPTMNSMDD